MTVLLFSLCVTHTFSQLPQQGDRQCGWVSSAQKDFFLLFLVSFPPLHHVIYSFSSAQHGSPLGCGPSSMSLPCHGLLTDRSPVEVSLPHSGFPAVLQDYLLSHVAPPSKIASLAMSTTMTSSRFSSAPSISPSMCPLCVSCPSWLPCFPKHV